MDFVGIYKWAGPQEAEAPFSRVHGFFTFSKESSFPKVNTHLGIRYLYNYIAFLKKGTQRKATS